MGAETTTDWITAIGSAFAAVGTVGAVVVALWQLRTRSAFAVAVTCREGITGDQQIGNVVALCATNTGQRLVKLTMAYLLTDDGRQVIAKFFNPTGGTAVSFTDSIAQSGLPSSLIEGESLSVYWRRASLDQVRLKEGFAGYVAAFFTDSLSNSYTAPFPGAVVQRHGLLWRKRRYAYPSRRNHG